MPVVDGPVIGKYKNVIFIKFRPARKAHQYRINKGDCNLLNAFYHICLL